MTSEQKAFARIQASLVNFAVICNEIQRQENSGGNENVWRRQMDQARQTHAEIFESISPFLTPVLYPCFPLPVVPPQPTNALASIDEFLSTLPKSVSKNSTD